MPRPKLRSIHERNDAVAQARDGNSTEAIAMALIAIYDLAFEALTGKIQPNADSNESEE